MVTQSVDDLGASVIPEGYVVDRVEVYFSKEHQDIIDKAIKHIRDYDQFMAERLIDSNNGGFPGVIREYENDRRNRCMTDEREKMLNHLSVMYNTYARHRLILKKC